MAERYLALLRGINVGGKNRLPMKDLVEAFAAAGCTAVRSYIQSGNVLFTADAALAAGLPRAISAWIAERFGYRTPVVLCTVDRLRQVVQSNPYLAAGTAEDLLHVLFMADLPAPELTARLDPDRSPPDHFTVRGQDIYLCLPQGAARSKLTNEYFDRVLGTVTTARNWRTVTTLLALIDG